MSRRIILVSALLILSAATALVTIPGPPPQARPDNAQTVAQPVAPGATAAAGAADWPRSEVETLVGNGQNWRAARLLREYLADHPDAPPDAILAAARAEAGWGGWSRVRELLAGRSWLGREAGGEGWFWLARSLEEGEDHEAAADAYEQYLQGADAAGDPYRTIVAELRQGLLYLGAGRVETGVAALEGARQHAPAIAPWINLLAAEALAEAGDTVRVRDRVGDLDTGILGVRARRARLRAAEHAGDPAAVRSLALRYREETESESRRAEYSVAAARAALALGDTAAASNDLRSAISAMSSGASVEAARLLTEIGGLGADDRLRIARVYDRHGNNRRAADGYRAWLEAGRGTAEERRGVRYALGRALFAQGEYAEAEDVLGDLGDAPAELAAPALYTAARAQYRRGERTAALRTFESVAERFPGSDAGARALFLVADLSHDASELRRAREVYRRVADDFLGHDRAGLALMRLAGMEILDDDFAGAARLWEEYRDSYPDGRRWLQSTYWAGRAYEEAGDTVLAHTRYRQVIEREPSSYYALQAAERLGQPFWPIPMEASPPDDPDARARIEQWLEGIDLLRDAGLYDEAEAEVDRWIERVGSDPRLLYPLAEALNQRGYTISGIGLGHRLEEIERASNPRLMRILYPFPYRSMIAAEATEKGLDPFLVAALTRQESLFKARITSGAGARGLMQIMPETGGQIAGAIGIEEWEAELLFNPEINVHLGTRFLADQMDSYDGFLPYVFSAYNAGPHRVERWREIYPEAGHPELFTERIPYAETRDYVRILLRNRAIYQGLYGDDADES